jgi:hypothetical protein
MSYPKTIKIYLIDDKLDGIKTAELSNSKTFYIDLIFTPTLRKTFFPLSPF